MDHDIETTSLRNSTNDTVDNITHAGHNLSEAFSVTIATYFALLTAGAVIFNGSLIATIACTRSLHSSTNLFMVNLAFCDILVGLGILPLDADFLLKGRFAYGVFVCGVKETFFMFSLPASIVNLFLLTLERFVHIVFPYKHCRIFTKRRILGILTCIWSYIVIVAIFPIIRNKNAVIVEHGYCSISFEGPYVIYQVLVNFICPLLFIVIMNLVIYRVASKHCKDIEKNHRVCHQASKNSAFTKNNNRNNNNNNNTKSNNNSYNSNNSHNNSNEKRNKNNTNNVEKGRTKRRTAFAHMMPSNFKAAKNIMVLVGVFLMCWLTYIVLVMWNILCGICHPREVTWTGNAINYSSIVLNPLLYGLLNKKVRRVLWKRCVTRRTKDRREDRIRLELCPDTQCMLTNSDSKF